jgi:death-on-curing protein
MTVYPTTEDLLALTDAVLPEVLLRDGGQPHAAALRPQTTVFGDDAYPHLWEKAAALMQNPVVLQEGDSRRPAQPLVAVRQRDRDVDEAEKLVIAVTTGELKDIPELARRLRMLRE